MGMNKSAKLRSLAARLRRLPKPQAPVGLKAKLLADIPAIHAPAPSVERLPWRRIAAGLAAACLLMVAMLNGRAPTKPTAAPEMSMQEIRQAIDREGSAARLLASANILASQPGGQRDAAEIQRYVARTYANTQAVKTMNRTNSLN